MDKILVIDDERFFQEAEKHCRTYAEGIEALIKERWSALYLDHDLGDLSEKEMTGYDILLFLEDPDNESLRPPIVRLVTANAGARPKMVAALISLDYKYNTRLGYYERGI